MERVASGLKKSPYLGTTGRIDVVSVPHRFPASVNAPFPVVERYYGTLMPGGLIHWHRSQ